MQIDVKITGSGTPEDVIASLEKVLESVKGARKLHLADTPSIFGYDMELEDATLMTTIKEQ